MSQLMQRFVISKAISKNYRQIWMLSGNYWMLTGALYHRNRIAPITLMLLRTKMRGELFLLLVGTFW